MFVLRQINNKINTMVASMSVICLMLFMTISILSVSLALRETMQNELCEMTPVDLNLYKTANLLEKYKVYGVEYTSTEEQREDSKISIKETLMNNGLDLNVIKDVVEIPIFASNEIKMEDFFGELADEVKNDFKMLKYESAEEIIKISDYNKIARLYGIQEYSLEDDEYIVICDYDNMKELRDRALTDGENPIKIAGKIYNTKYNECKSGFVVMSTNHTNTGIIIVPDNCNLNESDQERYFLAANYNANSDEEQERIEALFTSGESGFIQNLSNKGLRIDGVTKISIIESSTGLGAIVTFIAIYLGIIFLIASSAILALKQLTESSDNIQRYAILRKIGCDEKMIDKSLFRQIAIFFGLPLVLAIIHSIFGIQFAMVIMEGLAKSEELLPSIITTVIIITGIYGAYFMATYLGSKNIIKEEE